jgi:hypothetical protein
MAAPGNWMAQVYMRDTDEYGTPTSLFYKPGEVYPFTLTIPEEIISTIGQMRDSEGNVIGTMVKKGVPSGSMTFYDMTAQNTAAALGGEVKKNETTLVTLTDEDYTAPAEFGYFAPLGHRYITPGLVITNAAGTVTYKDYNDPDVNPAEADYVIDNDTGLIQILDTGAITKGQALKLTGTVAARTQARVDMTTPLNKLKNIVGTATNRYTNRVSVFELYTVRVVRGGEVNFSSPSTDTPESFQFNLVPQKPLNGKSFGTWDGLPITWGFSI